MIVILSIIVIAGTSYVSADNVTSTAHGGLVRLHNELASGTVSIGPLPMQSDIQENMFYWCSTIGSDDNTVDPKILQFVQENSPDLLNKIPDVEQTNQKIRGLYWETLQRKLISDTQEFLYLHGMTSSIIFQYAISATSCPPITDVNGNSGTEISWFKLTMPPNVSPLSWLAVKNRSFPGKAESIAT